MKKFRHFQPSVPKEEKKNKAGMYLALFIAAIMLFSVLAIFFENPNQANSYSYKKYSFRPVNNQWETKINGEKILFYQVPEAVMQYKPSSEITSLIKNSQGMVLSIDPSTNVTTQLQALDLFRFEMANTFVKTYPEKKMAYGVTENSSLYTSPVITCDNATYYAPVMEVKYSNETTISLQNSCIIVRAIDESSLVSVMDALRYAIFGVYDEA